MHASIPSVAAILGLGRLYIYNSKSHRWSGRHFGGKKEAEILLTFNDINTTLNSFT